MKGYLTGLFMLYLPFFVSGQVTITGKVVDAASQEPIPFVNIHELGSNRGTVTDQQGAFELVLPKNGQEIQFSFIGYFPQTIAVSSPTPLLVAMQPDSNFTFIETPITITASRLNLPSPTPVFNILPKDLQKDNDVIITNALNRVPGVFMHSGAYNTNRITIRGIGNRSPFSTTKIRAYLDDIPITNGIGETTIEDIDLSLIDRVEVWKGPTASTYGAGLGGMIHLHSQNSATPKPTALQLESSLGSFGLHRYLANYRYSFPEAKGSMQFNFNRTHSDGYRANNQYDRQSISMLGNYKISDEDQLTLFATYSWLDAQIPSSLNRDDYLNEPSKAAFTWAQVMGFEKTEKLFAGIAHKHIFKLKAHPDWLLSNRTAIFGSSRDSYESRPFNILIDNSQGMGFRHSWQWKFLRPNYSTQLSAGAELATEEYGAQILETLDGDPGPQLNNYHQDRLYLNLFGEIKQEINRRLVVEAGVNLHNNYYKNQDLFFPDSIDLSASSDFKPVLSPRLGLNYAFPNQLYLFATVSHGLSTPTPEDITTAEGRINKDIQPEQGWNFELGSRGELLNKSLQYELSVYSMRIRDLLVARRVELDQYIGINAGKTIHNGLEVYLNYQTSKWLNVFAIYSYSDYRFDEFIDEDQDYSGNELTGTAPHLFNAGLELTPFKNFYSHLTFQYVDAMPMRDDNSIYSEAYQVVNLKLGYRYKATSNWTAHLYLGVQNLLDEKYASMILINASSFGGRAPRYYYPGLPRNMYAGASLNFFL